MVIMVVLCWLRFLEFTLGLLVTFNSCSARRMGERNWIFLRKKEKKKNLLWDWSLSKNFSFFSLSFIFIIHNSFGLNFKQKKNRNSLEVRIYEKKTSTSPLTNKLFLEISYSLLQLGQFESNLLVQNSNSCQTRSFRLWEQFFLRQHTFLITWLIQSLNLYVCFFQCFFLLVSGLITRVSQTSKKRILDI